MATVAITIAIGCLSAGPARLLGRNWLVRRNLRRRRRVLRLMSLAALTWSAVATAYEAAPVVDGGSVSGVVRYVGTPPPRRAVAVTKDVEACGAAPKAANDLVVADDGGLQYAVVSLQDMARGKPFPDTVVTLDQQGCEYAPHVVLLPAGSALDIRNPDGILHNVHTGSDKNPPINRAQPKAKTSMSQRFTEPEIISLACDVHPWMRGWLVVQAHPYYAVTDAGGRFTLSDVPPGEYMLRVWHERLGELTQPITVRARTSTTIAVEMAPH
ncbi:MAG: carboxypeptidase regulatory-like domain-containing protein [bacterium]